MCRIPEGGYQVPVIGDSRIGLLLSGYFMCVLDPGVCMIKGVYTHLVESDTGFPEVASAVLLQPSIW